MIGINDIQMISEEIVKSPKIPNVNAKDMRMMQDVYKEHSDSLCVFIFLRQTECNKAYIEIDFYKDIGWPYKLKQFNINKGCRFSEDAEEELLSLIHKRKLYIEPIMFSEIKEKVNSSFPEWNMNPTQDIERYLDNLYYVSFRSGPKEIMYKSGLQNIAYDLNKIEDYNLIGSSPSQILEMPLNLCRIMNKFDDVRRISDEPSRKNQIKVYERYSSFISKITTTDQWNYLEQDCWGRKFNRKLFNYIKETNAELYRRYFEVGSILGKLNPYKKLPRPDEIYTKLQLMESIANHMEDKGVIDEGIQKHRIADFAYENRDYEAIVPSTMIQIIEEGINMHNCLANYLYKLSEGYTHVVFVRRKSDKEGSYMDIEITHREIIMARLKLNELPKVEDMEFLIEYAREKNLICNPRELIMGDGEYDELYGREDLIDFIERIEEKNADTRLDGDDFYFDGQLWYL
ncbi:MAG: PcfJ domain-containing protein [Lachnospiraceae bacterium]|nr:PcfJ domain-containing protein [Lachnospiraceae bacterium]